MASTTQAVPKRIVIQWNPHAAQEEVLRSTARFTTLVAGRRFGKTVLGSYFSLIRTVPGGQYTWGSYSEGQVQIGFEECIKAWDKAISQIRKGGPQGASILLSNGALWRFRTLGKPETKRGMRNHGVVIDEAGLLPSTAWQAVMRPTLSDFAGWAFKIGSPNGHNWFHEEFMNGGAGGKGSARMGYKSYRYPTSANPYIPKGEIETARLELPADLFRQEYEAEFIDNAGAVFHKVKQAVKFPADGYVDGDPWTVIEPDPAHQYKMGLDLAKSNDFTALVVRDALNRAVFAWRFSGIDYAIQIPRIREVALRYGNCEVEADSTGVGDPVVEQLRDAGVRVRGVVLTNKSKRDLAVNLAGMFDREEISLPAIPPLIEDLSAFRYQLTKAGNVQMAAPEGRNDDFSIATMLAFDGGLSTEPVGFDGAPAEIQVGGESGTFRNPFAPEGENPFAE